MLYYLTCKGKYKLSATCKAQICLEIPLFLRPFRTTLVGLEIFEVLIPRSSDLNFFQSRAFRRSARSLELSNAANFHISTINEERERELFKRDEMELSNQNQHIIKLNIRKRHGIYSLASVILCIVECFNRSSVAQPHLTIEKEKKKKRKKVRNEN